MDYRTEIKNNFVDAIEDKTVVNVQVIISGGYHIGLRDIIVNAVSDKNGVEIYTENGGYAYLIIPDDVEFEEGAYSYETDNALYSIQFEK